MVSVVKQGKLYDSHVIALYQKDQFFFVMVDGKQAYPDVIFSKQETALRYYDELLQKIMHKKQFVASDEPAAQAPNTWFTLSCVDPDFGKKEREKLFQDIKSMINRSPNAVFEVKS